MRKISRVLMPFLEWSLVKQILLALVIGVAIALLAPGVAKPLGFLGTVFISALKAVAPVLVFFLVAASIATQSVDTRTSMKPIIVLYAIGTFSAAAVAVIVSFIWPTSIHLAADAAKATAPGGIAEVLKNLILNIVDNPVKALANANYIGILAWSAALGVILRRASDSTREVIQDLSEAVTSVVRIVVRFAPLGILGLVSGTVAEVGLSAFAGYGKLILLLVGSMFFIAFVVNPLLVFACIRRNPYPLTLECLRVSGICAFFTRSSAANIPVNLDLCRRLKLDEGTYSISIPLGATINMAGAAITITILTLSAAYSLGVHVDFWTAVLLCFVASICAGGASGVPGGSLMLIPLACGLFGIDNSTAMQVVAVGFIIGVIQDSCETALNSASDVMFTAAACLRRQRLDAEKATKN
ncbi:serine/threonine transporter SstT [Mesosutterella porci]|nr:serine/threonine transporter SstT [Mesosutterella sp. oilRF-744-WT-GAM-9]